MGHPIRLVSDDDFRRSRITVFFRVLLALSHVLVTGRFSPLAGGRTR